MDLLLDTPIWLWSRLQPERLQPWAADAIADGQNQLWLSPVSIWEMVALNRKRRIELRCRWSEWLASAWGTGGYREASLSIAVVAAADHIELPHRDPMDWLLAATARHYRLTLVTADAQLLTGTGFARLRPQ